jgi:hypothetical protein
MDTRKPDPREAPEVLHGTREERRKGASVDQKTWTVDISLTEDGDVTRAVAILRTDDGREFRGDGVARRNPADIPSPQIGDELATARAMSELTHKLLETVARDIEETQGARPEHLVG